MYRYGPFGADSPEYNCLEDPNPPWPRNALLRRFNPYQDASVRDSELGKGSLTSDLPGPPNEILFRTGPAELSEATWRDVLLPNRTIFATHTTIASSSIQVVDSELMCWLARHPEDLYGVHPETFERIIAEIFKSQGFDVKVLGRWNQADGGIDILAIRRDTIAGEFRIGIQCKRYRQNKKVRSDVVWALAGRLDKFQLHKGVVATTARFERAVLTDLRRELWRIDLKDFDRIRRDLEEWQ